MAKDILIISDNLDAGGTEKVLQDAVRYIVEKGDKVTIWAVNGTKEQLAAKYPEGVKLKNYPFWYVDCKKFSPKWFYSRFCRVLFEKFLLKLKKWDCAVAFKEGEPHLLASVLRADRKTAMVHTDFGSFHWTGYCYGDDAERERLCLAGFDATATVSKAAAEGLISAIGDPGNLRVLYNPIDSRAIVEKAKLEGPEKPAGKTLLVSVGRLTEVKRYGMLIDICAELNESFPLELWIVGGGELEAELRGRVKNEKLAFVKLIGQKSNPYPYIACADIMVSSSSTESYGLTVQESLVLGVPVVAAYTPAIAEGLDKRFGIVSGSGKDELRDAIYGLLKEPGRIEALREDIARYYDKSSLWETRLEKIYTFITAV